MRRRSSIPRRAPRWCRSSTSTSAVHRALMPMLARLAPNPNAGNDQRGDDGGHLHRGVCPDRSPGLTAENPMVEIRLVIAGDAEIIAHLHAESWRDSYR